MYYLTKNFESIEFDGKFYIFSLESGDDFEMLHVNYQLYLLLDHFLITKAQGFSVADLENSLPMLFNMESTNTTDASLKIIEQLLDDQIIAKEVVDDEVQSTREISSVEKVNFEFPKVIELVKMDSIVEMTDLAAFSFNLY